MQTLEREMAKSLLAQQRYPVCAVPDGSSHHNSDTFPRRGRTAIGGARTRGHRDDRTSSAVTNRAVSQNPSALEAQEMALTRSKSLQDVREELVRTSRSALEKWEESQLAAHRSALLREIQELQQNLLEFGKTQDPKVAAECSYTINSRSTHLQVAQNQGRRKFNNEVPAEGIKYLISKSLLNETPEDVALFLHREQLDKTAVAKYLGIRKPFNKAVLACYVRLQDVRGIPLVESIRTFAKSVTLMDSPHWVKCVMDEFARHYHTSNPRSFDSAETCGAAAFSLVMLSHNLHCDKFTYKVTLGQFIEMGRDAACLSFTTLQMFYESILHEPIQKYKMEVKREVVLKGTLHKEDTKGNWSGRSFMLYSDSCLQYSKEGEEKDGRKVLLAGVTVTRCYSPGTKKQINCMFELKASGGRGLQIFKMSGGKPDPGGRQNLRLRAKSESERDLWTEKIQETVSKLEGRGRRIILPSRSQSSC